ncbi:hypothetical protein K1Y82_04030 [Bacillus inaquosorum]|uniref:hypothetical protein n=1 Tax=Bacillus inaquosorum TaxID=483913 RepID=UPI000A10C03D|nr:hypothetical protein [Bacillus inaquosorum]QJC87672.1 hypothetical protein HC662_08000 [Bacillus subtilis]QYX44235.1 hypothetical protein K1Y82_04030 [Bacillus inaquosorum]WNW25574.1 hypothetical protein RS399_06830 [Bacillus inaquosorum]
MNTIKREVGEQGKGFRLQRLRAIKLLLERMSASQKAVIYAGTEYLDDVYIKSIEGEKVNIIAEGDKNYESKSSFSFMSDEVKNSLISFLDCWFQYDSEGLIFCFYTNVKIGKEYNTKYTNSLGVTLPEKPIIELLINKDYDNEHLLSTVGAVLIDEYKKQYKRKDSDGFFQSLIEMSDELWINFLNKIDWKFEEEDEKDLELTLIEEIRKQSFYNIDLTGKESYVISALLDEFEKRQNIKDPLGRLISDEKVKTILLEVGTHQYKMNDPVYEQWEMLDPSDKRNLNEKIEAVTKTYSKKKLGMFARKIGAVKLELSKIDSKDKGAYQYRIYDACEERLMEMLESHDGQDVEPRVVDGWVDELVSYAETYLDEKSKDFIYPFKNKDTLRNTILELFDSCYLSFDG